MKNLLALIIAIPVSTPTSWEVLSFRSIPANKVEFNTQGLLLKIDNSASPLIYKLPTTEKVTQIEVEGKIISGELKLKSNLEQGTKPNDDFVLRLGLVAEGTKKLNWFQRTTAPAWIKRLHEIAPKGKGVDAIYFFEVSQDPSLIGRKRTHPLSELMKEDVVASLQSNGSFRFAKTLDQPLPVAGLWISSDGDDSQSKYQVLITKISLSKVMD